MPPSSDALERLRAIYFALRDALHAHMSHAALEEMSRPQRHEGGDAIFALDDVAERVLEPLWEEWARHTPFALVCEGVPGGRRLYGCSDESSAPFIVICDPVDGTRPLMYDKRSAWFLAAIAPNRGPQTHLGDIVCALQGELPTSRAGWADCLWTTRGTGALGISHNLYNGQERPARLHASGAVSMEGGFACLSKFFVGSKALLAQIEEELVAEVLGPPRQGSPQTFDDQYISTGGQLFELMTGRDRFNGDLRPLAHRQLWGEAGARLCSHPYDLCTELIAREAGVILTDPRGQPLRAPLDVETPVAWLGYANQHIRAQIEPTLQRLLRAKGLTEME